MDNELMQIMRLKAGSTLRRKSHVIDSKSGDVKDQELFLRAKNLRMAPVIATCSYFTFILASYIFIDEVSDNFSIFGMTKRNIRSALFIVENAIYLYCIFAFVRFTKYLSSEHSVLNDYKILKKTLTICLVATIVGYQRQMVQRFVNIPTVEFQFFSSLELFAMIWIISGQYSCEIDDYGEEAQTPLLIKGDTESNF